MSYLRRAEVALAYALDDPPYEALLTDVEGDIGLVMREMTLAELDHVGRAARRVADVANYMRVTRYAKEHQAKGANDDRVAAPDPAPGG